MPVFIPGAKQSVSNFGGCSFYRVHEDHIVGKDPSPMRDEFGPIDHPGTLFFYARDLC